MNAEKTTIAIYAQHVTGAGSECLDESLFGSDDVVVYDETPAELLAIAQALLKDGTCAGTYGRRVGRTLMRHLEGIGYIEPEGDGDEEETD